MSAEFPTMSETIPQNTEETNYISQPNFTHLKIHTFIHQLLINLTTKVLKSSSKFDIFMEHFNMLLEYRVRHVLPTGRWNEYTCSKTYGTRHDDDCQEIVW